jgi:ribonuclease HII
VTRDRLMRQLHDEHPGYNWRSNKGYGTPDHYSGLKTHGVTIHHRRTFAPIFNLLQGISGQEPEALVAALVEE